jgi:hypothetical protein
MHFEAFLRDHKRGAMMRTRLPTSLVEEWKNFVMDDLEEQLVAIADLEEQQAAIAAIGEDF